ncbi:MAG: hypothetical protein ISR80_04005 [Nitrosopumilus sp.]|nr:hypothetical protein [Nitrosopumilus sp.]
MSSEAYPELNKKIIEKIESLTDNKNERNTCFDMISFEIKNPHDSDTDFKERYKSIIKKFFPFEEE